MSEAEPETETNHAMLVIWGEYAQALGLILGLVEVPLHQKKVRHDPHTKVLEFFLSVLAGLEHLKDLSQNRLKRIWWLPEPGCNRPGRIIAVSAGL